MPDFIAVWLPLILGTLRKPAAQPMIAAPGTVSFGIDCRPPSFSARAPYDTRRPPSKVGRIFGWCLKRWNSSNGERYGFS